jgi:RNA polymerase sigma-70 factor (ECF subfamily)
VTERPGPAYLHKISRVEATISLSLDGRPLPKRESVSVPHDAKIDWQVEFQRHERWLRSIVYARIGEPGAVDDVIQDVALAAVRQSSPIADNSKVAPWLYRLAIRYVLLYRRKMGRTRKLVDRYAERFRPSASDDHVESNPLAWLLSEERRDLVRRALQQLRSGDIEILMLKYTENWSYHAIAEHLAVSHSAVEARLHRARERLRTTLAELESKPVGT